MGFTARTLARVLPLAAAASTAGLLLGGCVEQTLDVDSQPRGALVYLNDQEAGRTPMTTEFKWYGTYDVAVRAEGYETLKTRSPVIAPWWNWVPIDFIAEVLPFHFKDNQKLTYTLKPLSTKAVDPQELVRRGEALRGQLESGQKTVFPATTRATTRPATRLKQ